MKKSFLLLLLCTAGLLSCHQDKPKEQPKEYFEKPKKSDTQDVNLLIPRDKHFQVLESGNHVGSSSDNTRSFGALKSSSLLLQILGEKLLEWNKGNSPADNKMLPGEEKHFSYVKQITYGGNNAEAYFSFNDKGFSFQSDNADWGLKCDQIFYFPLKDGDMKSKKPQLISTGEGRTTCAYFLPGDTEILFASTHKSSKECPEVPQRTDHKYVWPVYNSYDIYVSDLKGHIKRQLTNSSGYDAEATVSPDGKMIVFTSTRSGDLELWTMNLDGTKLHQVTHELGYDGGACFSPDGKKLVFRASRPKTPEDVKEYKDLLANGQVMPVKLEIFTCNVDGSDLKQITNLGKANWAPCYHPSGKKIIFSSNYGGSKGFNFNLYMVDPDGKNIEKVTNDSVFAAFPMFSRDGKHLIFSSNRHNNGTHDTNLFLADWKD